MTFEHEPPSARQILADHGIPEDVIDGVLCVHAHELSEQIRVDALDVYVLHGDQTDARIHHLIEGMDRAADLIDPVKECGWQVGGFSIDTPPEICGADTEPGEEYCTRHLAAETALSAMADRQVAEYEKENQT